MPWLWFLTLVCGAVQIESYTRRVHLSAVSTVEEELTFDHPITGTFLLAVSPTWLGRIVNASLPCAHQWTHGSEKLVLAPTDALQVPQTVRPLVCREFAAELQDALSLKFTYAVMDHPRALAQDMTPNEEMPVMEFRVPVPASQALAVARYQLQATVDSPAQVVSGSLLAEGAGVEGAGLQVLLRSRLALPVVYRIDRTVELSFWSGATVTEDFLIVNHSRPEKFDSPLITRKAARFPTANHAVSAHGPELFEVPALVTARARHFELYDRVGNISTSNFVERIQGFHMYTVQPRYPLAGGWKTTLTLRYNVPMNAVPRNPYLGTETWVLPLDHALYLVSETARAHSAASLHRLDEGNFPSAVQKCQTYTRW